MVNIQLQINWILTPVGIQWTAPNLILQLHWMYGGVNVPCRHSTTIALLSETTIFGNSFLFVNQDRKTPIYFV